jgi:hypothetical protein
VAENPAPVTGLRRFRYAAPLYAVVEAKFRIEQRVWLQHLHFCFYRATVSAVAFPQEKPHLAEFDRAA